MMIGLDTNVLSRNHGCREFATFDTAVAKRHTKFAFVPKE
jgi:predicted nucleic-acid-binding protein